MARVLAGAIAADDAHAARLRAADAASAPHAGRGQQLTARSHERGGWLAVGDAAMAVDPLSSQGLVHALVAAFMRARPSIVIWPGDATAVDAYTLEIDRCLSRVLAAARRLLRPRETVAAVGLLAAPARDRRVVALIQVLAPKDRAMTNNKHRGRREFLKAGAAVVCAASGWPQTLAQSTGRIGRALHGMLIVGEQTAFLSHLPLFASPHDYQVILEVTFAKAGSDPQADYFNDRKRSGTKIYTLEPDRFVLPQLAAATPLRSFKANIYRGHFERFPNERAKEAARIGEAVNVTVTRVIHFRKFDPAAGKSARLEYLLFGKGTEIFAAHVITGAPGFRPGPRRHRSGSEIHRRAVGPRGDAAPSGQKERRRWPHQRNQAGVGGDGRGRWNSRHQTAAAAGYRVLLR